MSLPSISLLHKINELLAEVKELEHKIQLQSEKNNSLASQHEVELVSFKKIETDKAIDKKSMLEFEKSQKAINQSEQGLQDQLLKDLYTKSKDFLNPANLKTLVDLIIAQNTSLEYSISADPDLAKSIGLAKAQKGEKDQVVVDFGYKEYVIDINELAPNLTLKLLNKISKE